MTISSFYQVALIELIGLLVAIIFHLKTANLFSCEETTSLTNEEWLRIATTAAVVPLAVEYILDTLVIFSYPYLEDSPHNLEDPLGHGMVLLSLLPSSHFPLWIFGDGISYTVKDCLIGFSHAMVVCGVLGKLQNFAGDIWDFKECVAVMTLFIFSQLGLIFGHKPDTMTEYYEPAVMLVCILRASAFLMFLYSCRNIFQLSYEKTTSIHALINSKIYFCSILSFGLSLFLCFSMGLFVYTYIYLHSNITVNISAYRISILLFTVFFAAILPARIIRRGVTAMEHSMRIEVSVFFRHVFSCFSSF